MDIYKSSLSQKPDYLVCTCMGVMYSDIIKAIDEGSKTYDALQETLLVGTGCSSCVSEVCDILREETQEKS